jgi:PAT family beta-lactamase induction signal transducer AmpG
MGAAMTDRSTPPPELPHAGEKSDPRPASGGARPGDAVNPYTPPQAEITVPAAASAVVAPWLFCVLMVPFGISSGFSGVALAALLARGGVTPGEISALAATGSLPHVLKLLWAPAVDVTLTTRRWYLLSLLAIVAGVSGMGGFSADRASLAAITAIVVFTSVGGTVLGMAVDSFMAHCTAENRKGQAGGWSQAGNLGGNGIGGGLGLLLAVRVSEVWMASVTIAVLCLLCALPLLCMPKPPRDLEGRHAGELLMASLRDLWRTIRVRRGLLALLLCFVPLGIGASSSVWPAVAKDWGVDEDGVALIAGVLGGIVCALGSLTAGFLCDRWHRQRAYVFFGFLVAAAGLALAVFPRTPTTFTIITLAFSFCTGLSWAGYSAFVLEAIGKGAAATKYSAYASLANAPIWYMGHINAWTHDAWGTDGMLYFEAGMGVLGAVVFLSAARLLLRGRAGDSVRS